MRIGKTLQKCGDIEQFLTHLAVKRNVAPSTQNQALNAIIFLYREVLDIELKEPINAIRAKKPLRLPVVLTKAEVSKLINTLSGTQKIIGMLLYGAGLRLMECIRLRVKDIDFNMDQIVVRGGKGDKDRITLLPQSVKGDLQKHLDRIQLLHNDDLAQGYGKVFMPRALERKFKHANQQWIWQYVFPSKSISKDPRKLVHKGSYQKNSKAHDNIRLSKSRVCFAIRTTVPVPVLLQRSLMHSNSARFSQTIIHSAPFKDLNEKLPDPSSSQFVKSLIGKMR